MVNEALHPVHENKCVSQKIDNQSNSLDIFTADSKLPSQPRLKILPMVFTRCVPLPHCNALQNYVQREKCKVNDVIFSSGCEAMAINPGNKIMRKPVFSFTGGTSVRLKNIFTAISRYPTGQHEINRGYFFSVKVRNLFHRVDTIGNIFTSGAPMMFTG